MFQYTGPASMIMREVDRDRELVLFFIIIIIVIAIDLDFDIPIIIICYLYFCYYYGDTYMDTLLGALLYALPSYAQNVKLSSPT